MAIQTKEYYNGEHQLIANLVKRGVRRIAVSPAWNCKGWSAYSLERDGTIGVCITDRPYQTLGALKSVLKATFGDVAIWRM